jgi:DNA repair photolyase
MMTPDAIPCPEDGPLVPADVRRGRGAVSNRSGRFERFQYRAFDDGWGRQDEEAPPFRTKVLADTSRTVIARNKSPDIGFDQSINPYRGCEHGCFYCYARPSHAWLGLSPGLDFESTIFAKHDAPALLRAELSKKAYKPSVIALSGNTDPYQPVEKELRITRGILEVLLEARNPVAVITKSQMIVRDLDILAEMARLNLVRVALSVTTLDRKLARRMEPRAATPTRRLDTLRRLAEAGVPTSVMVAPVFPALNDHEIEDILKAAAGAGVSRAGYVLARLPLEIADMAVEWLEENAPGRAKHVLNLIREARGGRDYDSNFFERQRGTGPYAELIRKRFQLAVRRFGLDAPVPELATTHFQRPKAQSGQLSLF